MLHLARRVWGARCFPSRPARGASTAGGEPPSTRLVRTRADPLQATRTRADPHQATQTRLFRCEGPGTSTFLFRFLFCLLLVLLVCNRHLRGILLNIRKKTHAPKLKWRPARALCSFPRLRTPLFTATWSQGRYSDCTGGSGTMQLSPRSCHGRPPTSARTDVAPSHIRSRSCQPE